MCKALAAAFKMLWRNPQLAKVMLAAGLQGAAMVVCDTFVLNVLKGQIWASRMAEYGAYAGIAINITAAITGGPFGRMSDLIDRRIAFALSGLLTLLPTLAVLIFGLDAQGLLISTIVRVLCSVGYTCNMGFALANDLTPFEDRELMSGVLIAVTNFMQVVLNGVPAVLIVWLKVVPENPKALLYCSLSLSALFFITVFTVRLDQNPMCPEEEEQVSPTRRFAYTAKGRCPTMTEPFRLMFRHRRLRRLNLSLFLMSTADTLTMAVGGQFYLMSLGLIPNGTDSEIAMVNVASSLPGQILVLPGLILTGFLAKQRGSLRLTRQLIPFAATCILFTAGLAFVKTLWFLPLVVVLQNYASLPRVPMMRIVAGVAPPGRMGEAISAVGISSQFSGLLGNGIVALLNPILLKCGMQNPLWIYFIAAGGMTLAGILPLVGTPKNGWGVAAGRLEDFTVAVVWARVAKSRWKKFVQKKRETRRLEELAALEAGMKMVGPAAASEAPMISVLTADGERLVPSLRTGLDLQKAQPPQLPLPTGPLSPSGRAAEAAPEMHDAPSPVLLGRRREKTEKKEEGKEEGWEGSPPCSPAGRVAARVLDKVSL